MITPFFRVDGSNKIFHEEWQTSEEEDKFTTSVLKFEEWPEDLSDTQIKCAVFNGDDLLYDSDKISLLSHGKFNLLLAIPLSSCVI